MKIFFLLYIVVVTISALFIMILAFKSLWQDFKYRHIPTGRNK